MNGSVIDLNVDTSQNQRMHIWTLKCVQIGCAYFDRPVAPHKLVSEVNAYFWKLNKNCVSKTTRFFSNHNNYSVELVTLHRTWNWVIARQNQSANKVISTIASRFETRYLRTSH